MKYTELSEEPHHLIQLVLIIYTVIHMKRVYASSCIMVI